MGKESKSKHHPLERGKLGQIYHERESKTNAGTSEDKPSLRSKYLDQVQRHILRAGYYSSLEDQHLLPDFISDIPFRSEQKIKPLRFRANYDTIDPPLLLFSHGIEVRVEKRMVLNKHTGIIGPVFIQTVKVGDDTANRLEVETRIDSPCPDLSCTREDLQKIIKRKLGIKNFNILNLRPVSVIGLQSWKTLFHPNGDLDTLIEHKNDTGRLLTVFGDAVDIFQTEQELVCGDEAYLDLGKAKLLERFNFLTSTTDSKPSEGSRLILPPLDDPTIQQDLLKRLPEAVDPQYFEPILPLGALEAA